MLFSATTLATLAATVLAAGGGDDKTEYSPLHVPAVPLAQRSVYTNFWSSTANGSLETSGVMFWTGRPVGWTGVVEVDGKAYQWMGRDDSGLDTVKPSKVAIDTTWSNYTYEADGVKLNAGFFSPMELHNLCRTSIPLSYLHVSVSSDDGKDHKVRLYNDIDGRWSAPENHAAIKWEHKTNDDLHSFNTRLEKEWKYGEFEDTQLYGDVVFSTAEGDAEELTYQAGPANKVREVLGAKDDDDGDGLPNKVDDDFRPPTDNEPVFAYLHDFGEIDNGADSAVLYTIGAVQKPGLQFNTTDGYEEIASWWTKCYGSQEDMVKSHFDDFERSSIEGGYKFEHKVRNDIADYYGSESGLDKPGSNEQDSYYANIAVSARQIMGAYAFAERPSSANHTENPYVFQKELSSNGMVNTVDLLYPAAPFWLWIYPEMVKWQNEPVMHAQELFSGDFTLHDIGKKFPNATSFASPDEAYNMPLEESGNMIILHKLYHALTGDDDYLKENYHWLKQFTKYLTEYSEFPEKQLSTDDFQGELANQTNLAMKGIVGIECMADIANVVGDDENAKTWKDKAAKFFKTWQKHAVRTRKEDGQEYTLLAYDDEDSFGTLYNAYPAFVLGYDIGDDLVSKSQKWGKSINSHFKKYGPPLDSRNDRVKSDWLLWMAGYLNADERAKLVTTHAKFIDETPTELGLTDLYDANTAEYPDVKFIARPVVGGHFSLLMNHAYGLKKL